MKQAALVLASGSAIRRDILTNAGLQFSVIKPDVDESVIKAEAQERGLPLEETAALLADSKALAVDAFERAYVIGSDQILEFEGKGFDKPASVGEARERLRELQGKTHRLLNAVTVTLGGAIVFRHLDTPTLHMRAMTDDEIDRYFDEADESILKSVGAYQVEGLGMRLFERIEGDYYAVLGLSIYPLLTFLKSKGAIPF